MSPLEAVGVCIMFAVVIVAVVAIGWLMRMLAADVLKDRARRRLERAEDARRRRRAAAVAAYDAVGKLPAYTAEQMEDRRWLIEQLRLTELRED